MKSKLTTVLLVGSLFLNYNSRAQGIFIKGNNSPNFLKTQKAIQKLERESLKEKKEQGLKNSFEQENDDDLAKAKRWEWFWRTRVSKEGWFPRPDYLTEETKRYNASLRNPNARKQSSSWSFVGPTTTPGGYEGLGRVTCVTFHPTDPQTFWIGSPDGGIWKTTDAGAHWATLTDQALPVLGVSDIAVNPNHPDTMYIATGDGDRGSFFAVTPGRTADTHSIGVLMSADGGITWNPTGLTYSVTSQATMRRIVINPSNTQIVLVATSSGIYKTSDAGQNWTQSVSGSFSDIQFKPGDPNTVYAAKRGAGSQVYLSTNGGSSFSQASNFTGASRISLGVTPSNPSIVDALCSNSSGGFGGLYRSTTSGASFSVLYADNNINILNNDEAGTGTTGQGTYDLYYAISPVNENKLFVGGVNSWVSTDGGTTWTINTMWTGSNSWNTGGEQVVHADKHWIAFNPLNSSMAVQCNDGGVYLSNNGGMNWSNISDGLGISQMYRISCSATNPNRILIGMQDNGSRLYDGNSWQSASGGDGMNCIIDPVDSTIYTSYVYGRLYRSSGQNNWEATISDNIPNSPQGEWLTPFTLDANGNIYAGYTDVYKSTDKGDSWTNIGNGKLLSGNLNTIAVAASDPQVIVAGDFYTLLRTNDGGANWNNITNGLPGSPVSYVTIHSTDPLKMWVSISGYDVGEKVYKTTDGGASWTNVSYTLPNIPVNCILYDKNSSSNRVFIGTDIGVFYIDDTMSDWVKLGTALPNVVISHLDIQYSAYKLRAGTFGRGVWEIDLSSLNSGAPIAHFTSSASSICDPASVTYTNTTTGTVTSYSWNFGPGATPATATTAGPHTVSYGSSGSKIVTLVVSNTSGIDSVKNTVVVNPAPNAPVISYNSGSMLLTCTASGSPSYQWKYNSGDVNGANSSALQLGQASPQGTYTCVITDGNSCTAVSNALDVSFPILPPVAHFTANPSSVCESGSVTFTNTSTGAITSYKWDFGAGATPASATTAGPHNVSYSGAGSKTISLVITNSSGADSTTQTVTVNPAPAQPLVTYDSTAMLLTCTASGSPSYQWQVNGGNISGANSSTLQLNQSSAQGNYTCIISDGNGCSALSNVVNVKMKTVNGVNLLDETTYVDVFPNPASSAFNIRQRVSGYVKSVSLVSVNGQNLVKKVLEKDEESLDLSKFSNGMYFIKMETKKGFLIKKIQIKH